MDFFTIRRCILATFTLIWITGQLSFQKNSKSPCTFKKDALFCSRHLPSLNYPVQIKVLSLENIEWVSLDLTNLVNKFPKVSEITVNGKNITSIVAPPVFNQIKILRLNNIHLSEIDPKLLNNLPHLKILDLEHNSFKTFPSNVTFPASLDYLYLNGNKFNCSMDLTWILELTSTKIRGLDNLTCYQPYNKFPIKTVAEFIRSMKSECPEKCDCSLRYVFFELQTDIIKPVVEVNCSNLELSVLPEKLPKTTKVLHVENNFIEDLKPLLDNPIYQNICELYIDNNSIVSIDVLEGSYWLDHFQTFSLRGNKISELPAYALYNALGHNHNKNFGRLFLGDNPWRCNCLFTPVFQEMIFKLSEQIDDADEIKCSYVEGDENSLVPVKTLSRSSVCRLQTGYTVHILDLINIILASLIIFVLAKLAYDYYCYKSYGQLPWIVTKMP